MENEERIAGIMSEWQEALDRGEAPDTEAWLASNPDIADELRSQFRTVELLYTVLGAAAEEAAPAPKRLGPYRLVRRLGGGGMGTVWLAEADDGPGDGPRLRALKLIHPHLLVRPGCFQRFLREAEIGRAVSHPNVVETLGAGRETVDGRTVRYLVMDYVEGQTLRELQQELGRVPEELCRHVGREVAKGLVAIHAAGVVHRDLKPENVLITAEDAVKIMDLGVAKLAEEAVRLSMTGLFLGTFDYAAPEQFERDAVDTRTDLFSLGVVLYELLTGEHPFLGEDVPDTIRRILESEPPDVGERNPRVSRFLEVVVRTLLAKDPADRFESAAELVGVLESGERSAWWKARDRAPFPVAGDPPVPVARDTSVYGREDELARLSGAYDRAAAGASAVVLLRGEAGIGKTRLVDEFVARRRRDGGELALLYGAYAPGGAATPGGAYAAALRLSPGSSTLPAGPDAFADRILRALPSDRPVLLAIEDLHLAPPGGGEIFLGLARAAVPGLLLVGTAQPEAAEDAWATALVALDHAEAIDLGRLGPKALARLLEESLRSSRLADEIGMRIGRKSDGNPFFVFEILRGLREMGLLERGDDGAWRAKSEIRDIRIPSSVTDLIRARLEGLGDEEREILDVAACCGFEFDPRVVADVLGVTPIPVLRRLAALERRHRLVRSEGDRFRFEHDSVRESLHEDLPALLAREYLAAIGDARAARGKGAEGDEG